MRHTHDRGESCEPDAVVYFDLDRVVYICVECSRFPRDIDFETQSAVTMLGHMLDDHLIAGESVSASMFNEVHAQAVEETLRRSGLNS